MALDPIVVRFATSGIPEVQAAFAQVATQARKFEEQATIASSRGSRARTGDAQRETRERHRLLQEATRDLERSESQRTRVSQLEEKKRELHHAHHADTLKGLSIRAEEAAARATERLEELKTRIRERSSTFAIRASERLASEEIRNAQRAQGALGRMQHRQAHARMHALEGHAEKWGERFSEAGSVVGATIGLGGAFAIEEAARGRLDSQRTAARISAIGNGAAGTGTEDILKAAGEASVKTATDKKLLLAGTTAYAEQTRDVAGAMAQTEFFGKAAKVTGKSPEEIANAMAMVKRQDPAMAGEDLRNTVLATMSAGAFGRAGAGDVTQMIAKFGKGRGAFGGDKGETLHQLIGLGQIAFEGAGTAKGAAAAVNAITKESLDPKKRAMMAGFGVKFDATGRVESPEQMLTSLVSGTKGNIGKLGATMGAAALPLFAPLAETFRAAGGGAKGEEAVRAKISGAIGQQLTEGSVDKKFDKMMEEPVEKFDQAVIKIKEAIEDAVAPALDKLARTLSDPEVQKGIQEFIEGVGKVARLLLENPFKGLGAIVLAMIAKDVAAAQIGNVLKSLLTGAAGGGGGLPGGAAAGALGKVGAALGVGAAAAGLTALAIDSDASSQGARQGRQALRGANAVGLVQSIHQKIAAGTITASDLASVQGSVTEAKGRVRGLKNGPEFGFLEAAAMGAGVLTGQGGAVREAMDAKQHENTRALKEATDEVNLLKKACAEAAAALAGLKGSAPNAIPPVTSNSPNVPIPHRS